MFKLNARSTVIGVDVHKYSHTAVAMDAWGQKKDKLTFSNQNLSTFLEWLPSKETTIVALEDVNGNGFFVKEAVLGAKYTLYHVPSVVTEKARKQSTKRAKSDTLDAMRVGKAILTKIEEALLVTDTVSTKEELARVRALDLLLQDRRDLVRTQTALKNQLHTLLHKYYGDSYLKSFCKRNLVFYVDDLSAHRESETDEVARVKLLVILRKLKRLQTTQDDVAETKRLLRAITKDVPQVQALCGIPGCGLISACSILAEIGSIKRFPTADALTAYAGVAPRDNSSAGNGKVCTNPYGNRTLNRALHSIALTQSSRVGDGRTYYLRKKMEGKTSLWALRCLRYRICKRVFKVLKDIKD